LVEGKQSNLVKRTGIGTHTEDFARLVVDFATLATMALRMRSKYRKEKSFSERKEGSWRDRGHKMVEGIKSGDSIPSR